ncbi:MAG TPA: protoporphyrinogen oxidase [Candidatus Eisenbacteria bacterium]|nr:protoporphyrinogen oxidase [Candidatus Eisenbacteria bacterium]
MAEIAVLGLRCHMTRVVVVGGGIAGLAAAHRLLESGTEKQLDLQVLLVEAAPRLGGCIVTERVGEFLVEGGPDSFITEKPWAVELCRRLSLTGSIIATRSADQRIYVVHEGKLEPLPEGFLLMAPTRFWPFVRSPLFSWRGKARIAAETIWPRGRPNGDESLASFVRRRFGREALERVAQPLIGGIYAADPERLSLASTMPRFREMERKCGSIIRAMRAEQRERGRAAADASGARWTFFAGLKNGIGELVDALVARLPAGTVRLGSRATTMRRKTRDGGWLVVLESGETLEAEAVILALPAYAAARLVEGIAPEASRALETIRYASTATVNLAYRETEIPGRLAGFGFVVPAVEHRRIVACTFSSLKYPGRAPAGHVLLRAFVGGSLKPEIFERSDDEMLSDVRKDLAELLGIRADPLFSRIHRHAMAMPQYHIGHTERVERIEAQLAGFPGIALAGSAYRGVGIPDCIRSGEQAAERIVDRLAVPALRHGRQ